jgi:membrane glycosyltransferase
MLMLDAEDLEAVNRLAAKPELLKVHRQMLPPPRRPRLDPVDPVLLVAMVKAQEARDLCEALASLSRAEKAALLADATGVERLVGLAAREADPLRSLSTQQTAGAGAKYMPG